MTGMPNAAPATSKSITTNRLMAFASLLIDNCSSDDQGYSVKKQYATEDVSVDHGKPHQVVDMAHQNTPEDSSLLSSLPSPFPSTVAAANARSISRKTIPIGRVTHDYRDYANSFDSKGETRNCSTATHKSTARQIFPVKLHQLLSLPSENIDPTVISWAPHGRCFSVHKPGEFKRTLMKVYFNQNSFASFIRQLNLYGFKRITRAGSDCGSYYHELFLRGKLQLCYRIQRQRVKGFGRK